MDFLRSLKARGLDGVKLVISDAHTGLKGAIARVFEATWQRVADQLRPRWPKLADLMDASEHDVLAYIGLRPFLPQTVHRTVCRLRRTGANSRASTAPSCTAPTRSSA